MYLYRLDRGIFRTYLVASSLERVKYVTKKIPEIRNSVTLVSNYVLMKDGEESELKLYKVNMASYVVCASIGEAMRLYKERLGMSWEPGWTVELVSPTVIYVE